jgi:hypothetical protein
MSIPAVELKKLIKIVRQYEVIYGGGISSGDAAVREECERLVASLESELSGAPRSQERGTTYPSSSRSAEIARLSGVQRTKKNTKAKQQKKLSESVSKSGKTKQSEAKGETAPASKKSDKITVATKKTNSPKPAKTVSTKSSRTSSPAKNKSPQTSGSSDKTVADVRSRNSVSERAALTRSNRIAGNEDRQKDGDSRRRIAALHLFDAFAQNKLPKYGGYIVCVRFSDESGYTVIEIIGYENLQDIFPEGDTLVFKSVGCKLFAIVEPATYLLKSVEPVNRPSDQMVPYRFTELQKITTKRFQTILIGRKPVFMPTSFSVYKPEGDDLAVLFYDTAEVYANIQDFVIMILRDRLSVPAPDSRKAAEAIARGAREFHLWLDET